MASNGGYKWYRVRRSDDEDGETEIDEMVRENEKEESDELVALLSLLRILAAFDLMSPWYSAGQGGSEPFKRRKWASTWQLEGAVRGRMTVADVQCRGLVVSTGADC